MSCEKRLFILEDNLDLCEVLISLFIEQGYSIDYATSTAEALQKLSSEKFDLIVADFELPVGTGADFLNQLRTVSQGPNARTNAIVYSGYARQSYRERAANAGFVDYCVKGEDVHVLLRTVKKRMETAGVP